MLAFAVAVASIQVTTETAAAEVSLPGNAANLAAAAGAPSAVALPGGTGGAAPGGDFGYTYPVTVPPGRGGHTPTVALSYNSGGNVHGGVAAGWQLSGAVITVDPAAGTVRPEWADGGTVDSPRNFLAPSGNPLVRDPDLPVATGGVGYRELNNAAFDRYEFMGGAASNPYWWQVFHSDGTVSRFGLKSQHPATYAPIVSQVDTRAHELRYNYATVGRTTDDVDADDPREFLPTSIEYRAPGQPAGAEYPYARVLFEYGDPVFCGPSGSMPAVGSTSDYRFGFGKLSGTRKLNRISTWKRAGVNEPYVKVRDVDLGYSNSDSCASGSTTPFRELVSMQQRAYAPNDGAETVMPPTRFTYGKAASYVEDAHYGPEVEIENLRLPDSTVTVAAGDIDDKDDGDGHEKLGKLSPVAPGEFSTGDVPFTPVPDTNDTIWLWDKAWRISQAQANGESLTEAWVDVNNDGLVDVLRRPGQVNLAAHAPETGGCQIDVYLNRGGGNFVKNHPDFGSFSLRNAMADVPVSSSIDESGAGELICSLSRSFSPARSNPDHSVPCVGSGSGDTDFWAAGPGWGSVQQVEHGFVDIDKDGFVDLLSQPISSVNCPYVSTFGVESPRWPSASWSLEDTYPYLVWPNPPIVQPATITLRQRAWYVYRNTGNGFADEPIRVSVPAKWGEQIPGTWLVNEESPRVPQELVLAGMDLPAQADSQNNRSLTSLTDMNGDGFLDFVAADGTVRVGSDGGALADHANEITLAQGDDVPPTTWMSRDDGPAGDDTYHVYQREGFGQDINGDSLPDWVQETANGTLVRFNTGRGFGDAATDGQVYFSEGAEETRRLHSVRVKYGGNANWQGYQNSHRTHQNRMVDLDYDGLVDNYRYNHGGTATLYVNGGRQWVRSLPVASQVAETLSGTVVNVGVQHDDDTGELHQYGDRADYAYRTSRQAIDVNGDGLLDLVSGNGDVDGVKVRFAIAELDKRDAYKAPARLMRTVTNGFGAKTTIDYERNAQAARWVAAKVTVNPGHGEPSVTTVHEYRAPIFTEGPYGQNVFRGFGDVRTLREGVTDADDVTTVNRYSYYYDYRGLPERTLVIAGNALKSADPNAVAHVRSVVTTDYHVKQLGLRAPGMQNGFPSVVVLPKKTASYACPNRYSAINCLARVSPTVSETSWVSRTSGGRYALELPEWKEVRFTDADGKSVNRRTVMVTTNVAWTGGAFTVAPGEQRVETVVDGITTVLGGQIYTYHDAGYRYVHTVKVTDPLSSSGDKISVYTYYQGDSPAQGLVKRSWAPAQYHGTHPDAPGYVEYTYDAAGVHLVKTKNPLGHIVTRTVDSGTGATLGVAGPDYVCPDSADAGTEPDAPSACGIDEALFRQQIKTTVDGFGRVLELRRHPASAEPPALVYRAIYDDMASFSSGGVVPSSSVIETPAGDGDYSHSKTEIDGLGRALEVTVQQDPHPDKVVTYDYDAAGRPSTAYVPNASGTGDPVQVRTTYDSLDRVIEVAEVSPTPRILTRTDYNGLVTTNTKVLGDGRQGAVTRTTVDAMGQLVTVEEKTDDDGGPDGGPTFATTRYRYDGGGRIAEMTDPDGIVTEMTHDLAGNRLTITTAGRTWNYGYTDNNKLSSIREPLPEGADANDYTHRIYYDDLDRVEREVTATRNLQDADIDELKIGDKVYYYDRPDPAACPSGEVHQIGKLSCAKSPVATTTYTYSAYGDPKSTSQTIHPMSSLGADRLQADYTYHATGTLESEQYRAFLPGGSTVTYEGTPLAIAYDRDGAPSTVSFTIDHKPMTIRNQRNAAGVTYQRDTNVGNTGGFARPVFNRNHDAYGRIVAVSAAMGSVDRYLQTYSYDDAGEIDRTQEQLGDQNQPLITTDYDYDHRGQLTAATQYGGAGYIAQFTHTPGGRMATTNIATTCTDPECAAPRVTTRSHTYAYQNGTNTPVNPDPQRLYQLLGTDGAPQAAYTYDEAGNTLTRPLPDGTTVTQTWDGNHLRKVTLPNGEHEIHFYDGSTRVGTIHKSASGTVLDGKRWFGPIEVFHDPATGPAYRHMITLAGETIGRLDGDGATGTFEHYLTTPQGHHVLALDAAGDGTSSGATTMRVASYSPYGDVLAELTASTTPAGKYLQEFNGKQYDDTSGLHYYGYRYYDPFALQWTSADPLYRISPDRNPTTPRAANLYTYTDNNPVGRTDPNGLCTVGQTHFGCVDQLAYETWQFGAIEAYWSMFPIIGSIRTGVKHDNWVPLGVEVGLLALGTIVSKASHAGRVAAMSDDPARVVSQVDDIGRQISKRAVPVGEVSPPANRIEALVDVGDELGARVVGREDPANFMREIATAANEMNRHAEGMVLPLNQESVAYLLEGAAAHITGKHMGTSGWLRRGSTLYVPVEFGGHARVFAIEADGTVHPGTAAVDMLPDGRTIGGFSDFRPDSGQYAVPLGARTPQSPLDVVIKPSDLKIEY